MFNYLFPSFEDKNIQIKHNTLISYALFLFVQSVFTGYSTFNIGPNKAVFIITTLITILIPILLIVYARRKFKLASNLFVGAIWTTSASFLLMVHGDNSVIAFLLTDILIISALASLAIRWYVGIIYGIASILIALIDLFLEKQGMFNIFLLEPIPAWIYFIGFSIMLGTMLIISMANALSFENIFFAYNAELKKRLAAESLLIDQNILLDDKVTERTREIEMLNGELTMANMNLFDSNKELTNINAELYHQREELSATLEKLKITQEQLVQSEKMASLGVLSAGIAHEINNPLNFIHGGITGIEKYFAKNLSNHCEKIFPLINAINVGVKRATDIVSSLNHFSRHDSLPKAACDVHSILDNCLIMLQSQLKNRVEIVKNYTSKSLVISAYEGKLHQALLNIISNAEQSIEKNGMIIIGTDFIDNKIIVSITDSGCGINNKDLSKIFDPFFTTKAPGKGTGLGLSITYNIIREHNGTIAYESQLGKGTKATIYLPTEKAHKP